jgi:sugar lactone lactonase YvrE
MKMFKQLIVLGLTSGTIYRVDIPHGRVDTLYNKAGPEPDGVVVENGIVYWTTMGTPTPDPSADDGFDFSARNGGLHSVWLDGSGARDVIPTGAITTGKQLASDGAGTLYWGDREGSRVSRVRIDGTGLMDLVVNTPDDTKLQECVGVAVDPARGYLYWTQKGPANGGKGRIFRAGLEIPAGQTAANRTDIEVLWNSLPEPIDLEIKGEWLYWTDRGDPPTGNTLNRAPLPAAGDSGRPPEILAGGFHEDIGLALDGEAGVAYVADLAGRIHVVPISESAKGSSGARVLADLHEPLTGLAGLKASEL